MSPCHDLVRFVDGELDTEHAEAFRDHLQTCDACRTGLVEAVQLSAQLSTLEPPRRRETAVPLPSLGLAEPGSRRGGHAAMPRRHRMSLWGAGVVAIAAAAVAVAMFRPWPPARSPVASGEGAAPVPAFAAVTTRPYEIRFAYAGAAVHRPAREVARGTAATAAPTASVADRIPYATLSALQTRGDLHGEAIARAWNGESLGEVVQQLSSLAATPAIRSDRAALELLTASNDNVEPVLAALEALRDGPEEAVARAARWNYALLLARLDLPLSAAQAFRAIAGEREPGWSGEAAARAAPLAERGHDFEATWQRAYRAGQALALRGELVPGDLIRQRPGVLRASFYNAVRAAPSRERVLALAPMAAELDQLATQPHALNDYVQRVARLDFRQRAPLARAYADLLQGKPLARALTQETSSRDITDIVMGAMIEREIVADHRAWFRAASAQAGDPWFQVVLARVEADTAMQTGRWLDAEAILRKAESLCTPDLAYQCLTIERQLGVLYTELHRVHEALTVLQSAVRVARTAGEWGRYRSLLWRLADAERFHSATATTRAYAGELLLMGNDCQNVGQAYDTLAGAALIDADGPAARRYLTQALACEPADLHIANHLADIARLDPQPGDLAQLQAMLARVRGSGKLTAAERVLATEIEGRLVVEGNRAAGTALLREAIAEADQLPGEVIANKARANAYAVLTFAAARAGAFGEALRLVAEDLGLPPGACTVAMAAEDERAAVVVRGPGEGEHGEYVARRSPGDGALAVSEALARRLTGCPRVRVLAPAALQGQPRVLPGELAWSYVTGVRDRVAPVGAPGEPRPLVVANVAPPAYLHLPPLAIQPVASGTATTLSGPEATPARVLAAMADATEIQFHSHALMDVGVSDASHLVLSPDTDGHYALTTEAIRKIALRGHPIVLLAACHAAQGARYLHEPWSLPDAFLAVGARAVFAAATAIPDVESSKFFADVLARVRNGADPATALRDARLSADWRTSRWVNDAIVFE